MIYLIGNWELKTIKIGFSETEESAYNRLDSCQTGNCCGLEMLLIVDGDREKESYYHQLFSSSNKQGEWFYLTYDNVRQWECYFKGFDFRYWMSLNVKAYHTLRGIYPTKKHKEIMRILIDGNGNPTINSLKELLTMQKRI